MDEESKLARRAGIGGSDVAAILGLSPWKKPIDVWLEKKGLLDDLTTPNREFMLQLGQDLEPVIARLYERQMGKKLTLPFPVRWAHKKLPLLLASPDRFVEGENLGVELKSESQFSHKFGDPGTDEVPAHYLLQVAHYMSVMDYESWDVALLHAGFTFAVYTVKRDKELEDSVQEQILAWWEKHIVGDIPPEVDGTEGWSRYLKKKFPVNTGEMILADEPTTNLVNRLKVARLGLDFYQTANDELENQIKMFIGEHEGITGDFGKITWKKTKDTEKVDWELTFKDFLKSVADPEFQRLAATIQSIHTMPRQGVRRFLLTEPKHDRNRNTSREAGNLPANVREIQAGDRPSLAEASECRPDGPDRPYLFPQKP